MEILWSFFPYSLKRQRQTDRHLQTDTHRQTDRHRQTHTDRQTDRQAHTHARTHTQNLHVQSHGWPMSGVPSFKMTPLTDFGWTKVNAPLHLFPTNFELKSEDISGGLFGYHRILEQQFSIVRSYRRKKFVHFHVLWLTKQLLARMSVPFVNTGHVLAAVFNSDRFMRYSPMFNTKVAFCQCTMQRCYLSFQVTVVNTSHPRMYGPISVLVSYGQI
jgi:hypothetical protein